MNFDSQIKLEPTLDEISAKSWCLCGPSCGFICSQSCTISCGGTCGAACHHFGVCNNFSR